MRMSLEGVGVGVFGLAGIVAATLTGATVWLLLTDPVTLADVASDGDISPLVRELAKVLYRALGSLVRYIL